MFILQYGGIYMDSDVITIKRNQYIDQFANVLVTERHDLSNAFIKFEKGHPVVEKTCQNFVRSQY